MRATDSRGPVGAMTAVIVGLALTITPMSAARPSDPGPPLVLEGKIPLSDVSGRIDHMAVDLARRRLIIAELGNDTVDVVDLGSGNRLHRFGGLSEPQGVAYVDHADRLVIANGAGGSVDFFDASDFAARSTLDLKDDADNIGIDPRSGDVIVGYGAGALAVIDPAVPTLLRSIALPAHPESFQLDPRSGRAFANVPDAGEIAVVDLAAGKQIDRWTVPDLAGNFPMAFDAATATLAAVFRVPPRLALLDAGTGATLGTYETCGDADDVFFDAKRQRLYVSCGEGFLDVFSRDGGQVRRVGRISTSSGARTSLFVPELDRLFVAARAGLFGSDAAILVFRPE